jgi:serpin B
MAIATLLPAPGLATATSCTMSPSDPLAASTLAADLMRDLAPRAPDTNLALSPLSLETALALLLLGCRGSIQGQLARRLGWPTGCDVHADALAQRIAARPLQSASAIWFQAGLALQETYRSDVQRAALAELRPLPPGPGAADAINTWVARATAQRIRKLVDHVDTGTRLMLVNALHLQARWATPFDPTWTRPAPFHLDANRSVNVPSMNLAGQFACVIDATGAALRLPYRDVPLALDLLLPPAGLDPAQSLDRLITIGLRGTGALARTAPGPGRIALPRFTISNALALAAPLTRVGLGDLFQRGRCDLSGMLKNGQDFAVDNIQQSVWLAVDEDGTQAAAATSITAITAARSPDVPFELKFDRPFLCALRDLTDGAVLFLAIVRNPVR